MRLPSIFSRRNGHDRPVSNTDEDWRIIAEVEPFYGVLTNPKFLRSNIDDAAKAEFFATGEGDVGHIHREMNRHFGPFNPRSAMDFGCGVGRLTRALHDITGDAIGVDVAPGMVAEARKEVRAGLSFTTTLPDRLFGWIVSIIVFQHITPERGYPLLQRICGLAAPGGGITLQLPFYRREAMAGAPGGRLLSNGEKPLPVPPYPPGEMTMFDYDLSRVVMTLFESGFSDVRLVPTDHGGFCGAMIYGKRGG